MRGRRCFWASSTARAIFSPYGHPHAAHEEAAVQYSGHHRAAVHLTPGGDHALRQTGAPAESGELFLIAGKVQRIGSGEMFVQLLKGMRVQQHGETQIGADGMVVPAMGADIEPPDQITLGHRRGTGGTFFEHGGLRALDPGLFPQAPLLLELHEPLPPGAKEVIQGLFASLPKKQGPPLRPGPRPGSRPDGWPENRCHTGRGQNPGGGAGDGQSRRWWDSPG